MFFLSMFFKTVLFFSSVLFVLLLFSFFERQGIRFPNPTLFIIPGLPNKPQESRPGGGGGRRVEHFTSSSRWSSAARCCNSRTCSSGLTLRKCALFAFGDIVPSRQTQSTIATAYPKFQVKQSRYISSLRDMFVANIRRHQNPTKPLTNSPDTANIIHLRHRGERLPKYM